MISLGILRVICFAFLSARRFHGLVHWRLFCNFWQCFLYGISKWALWALFLFVMLPAHFLFLYRGVSLDSALTPAKSADECVLGLWWICHFWRALAVASFVFAKPSSEWITCVFNLAASTCLTCFRGQRIMQKPMVMGNGECRDVVWDLFLGISIPGWTLLLCRQWLSKIFFIALRLLTKNTFI